MTIPWSRPSGPSSAVRLRSSPCWRGASAGGACQLALVCDILIGTENTSFAITSARLGIPYNLTGILHVLNKIGMSLAREMFCTAQPVSGERVARVGILNHLVPIPELEILPLPWPGRSPRIPPSAFQS